MEEGTERILMPRQRSQVLEAQTETNEILQANPPAVQVEVKGRVVLHQD